MKFPPLMYKERPPLCSCGKVSFTKRDAQTKVNHLLRKGMKGKMRIYPCPKSNTWHLSSSFDWQNRFDDPSWG